MYRHIVFLVLGMIFLTTAFSQRTVSIKGVVTDSTGSPIFGASVKLLAGKDSAGAVTDRDGSFTLRRSGISSPSVKLEITNIGFTPFSKTYAVVSGTINAGSIQLAPEPSMLGEVIVKSVNPITVKEDTIEYKASAYQVREGAPVEDVIKKLPGVTVGADGQIQAQGKPVARVRVNGKDFFGGDVQTATKNLPADIIDNIQIIDDYGDQANLTGIKSGEPEKIININIRKDKNKGTFGSATVAAGTDDRYAGSLVANVFNGERQISFIGSINNTNANTFNFNGGGRGGGARGANFGGSERGGGGGNGISLTRSAGLNFRDTWGKKISVYGSYSFSSRSSDNISTSQTQDFNPMNIRFTERNSNSHSSNYNHRVTFNMEYKIDSMNYLKISPFVSTSSSSSESVSNSSISQKGYYTLNDSRSENSATAPNAGTDLTFNHKFPKKGRNLNISGNFNYSYRDALQNIRNNYTNADSTFFPVIVADTIQQQRIDITNRNTRTTARVSYTEPLGSQTGNNRTVLELNYEWNRSATENQRGVNDVDPLTGEQNLNPVQSNHFDYQFVTNRIGLSLKGNSTKYNYVIGVISQPTTLSGQSVGKDINTNFRNMNWIPSARFVYNFARSHSLTLTYGGQSREPDFMQLQPVVDSSNLNNIVVGNPNLRAELTRRLSLQYNKFDNKSGRSLFSNVSFDQTDNKIVNSRVNNPSGTGRTVSYLNTNGFYHVNGNGSYTQPFFNRKFTATVNFNASYSNNISYTDNQRNRGSNLNLRPGTTLRVDINDVMDAGVTADYTIYRTTTKYSTYTNTTKARTLNLGVNGKNYFFKDLTLGYDLSKVINYNFSSNVNANPLILNVYAEYRFLKNKLATVRVQGFDLFNENTGISRTIDETMIIDSRSNRLARYFLISFNYRLQKFGGGRGNGGNKATPATQGRQSRQGGGGNRSRM
ncbi:TonB-dependent receptor [Terrimonas sp. NA20]|uniref:TonB-dependent receptor n=1 Tax=Terrimonas ginsenosidimutans TaxID=2908004 RepID=A0ABS9KSH2_9BACT|nr:outer membrane beta-barrel protein [Terrimonas ginsenosidimutans]MCG2615278.1 TonB-dependent receptor [Terrimonas ginsenosidimutans]